MEINRDGMPLCNPAEVLPTEMFSQILGYLPWLTVQRIRIVQSLWKAVIEDHNFIKTYFPEMNVYSFPYRMDPTQYIRIAKQYKELTNLDLDAVSMTDDELKDLTGVKASQLCWYSSPITSKGLIQLLGQGVLASPVCFAISPHIENFTDEVLQECINRKIQIQSLDLLGDNKKISKEKFCEFVRSGGLTSPCQLKLMDCAWVDGEVMTTLIEAKVTCDQLDISGCKISQDDLFRLINAGGLTSLCSFLFNHIEEVNDQLLTLLLKKEIQLQSINSSATQITAAGFLNFIQKGGLASPCSIMTRGDFLTKEILMALAEKEIKIKALALDYDEPVADRFIEGVKYLLEHGKWSTPCELEMMSGHWLDDSILDQLISSKLVINKLGLDDCPRISAKTFCEFIQKDCLSSIGSELVFYDCPWLDSSIWQVLEEKGIKIRRLSLSFSERIQDPNFTQAFIQMSEKGVFNSPPCSVSLHAQFDDIAVIEKLAFTGISSLLLIGINYNDQNKEKFISLFRDPKSFKWLTQLSTAQCAWFDDQCQENLLKLRPRLLIIDWDKRNHDESEDENPAIG